MQIVETKLEEFEMAEGNTAAKKQFKTVVILSVIQNVVAILFFFLPFMSLLNTTTEIFSNPIFIIQLIIFRVIPLFALVKLISKRKIGWSLTIIFSIIDILQRIPTHKLRIDFGDLFAEIGLLLLTSISVLIISATLIYLLLKDNIRSLFAVSNKRLYLTIIIGITIFGLVQFLIAPYLINLVLKTSTY